MSESFHVEQAKVERPARNGKPSRDWRAHLTPTEAAELAPIEKEVATLRERLSWLGWQYHRLQNRASVRAGKAPS